MSVEYVYETINGVRCRIDTDTGEVVMKDYRYRTPIDIFKIKTKEQYNDIVKTARGKSKWRLWVGDVLLDLIIERNISIPAASVFCCLGREVGFNNMVFTTTKELQDKTKHTRQTITLALKELKDHDLIREASWVKEKGSRFFLLNPLYFFLGYYPYRDHLLKKWMEEDNDCFK